MCERELAVPVSIVYCNDSHKISAIFSDIKKGGCFLMLMRGCAGMNGEGGRGAGEPRTFQWRCCE